jgi:hypothetical protein
MSVSRHWQVTCNDSHHTSVTCLVLPVVLPIVSSTTAQALQYSTNLPVVALYCVLLHMLYSVITYMQQISDVVHLKLLINHNHFHLTLNIELIIVFTLI